jgi:superfamily II DNA or RNA helicase
MHSVPLTVTLYFGDVEWSCDCMGAMDPCAHVVAAAIALENEASGLGAADATSATEQALPATLPGAGHLAVTPAREMPKRDTAEGQGPAANIVSPSLRRGSAADVIPSRPIGGMTIVRGNVRQRRRLGYRFLVEPGGVALTRFLIGADDVETPLKTALSSPMSRAVIMEIAPREQDLRLDRLIGQSVQKYRVTSTLGAAMAALDGAPNVWFGQRAVTVNKEPVMPRVVVMDRENHFEVQFTKNPLIDEVVGPGLVLVGNELRPLGEVERTGMKLERLPLTLRFRSEQTGELVSKLLPELEKHLVVEFETNRLPGRTRTLKPRVDFELLTEGEVLVVRASLVYGSPAVAKVVGSKLVQLGNVTPKRLLDEEKRLELSLRDELDVLLERPLRLEGVDAGRFVERLERWRKRFGEPTSTQALAQTVELLPEMLLLDGEPVLRFSVTEADGKQSAVAADVVLRAHLEGIEQIPLPTGTWGSLPSRWLSTHLSVLEDYLAARDGSSGGRNAAKVLLGTSLEELGLRAPPGVEDYAARLAASGKPTLPADLNADLRPYQKDGVAWLTALRDTSLGGILADDMGLGKTLQTLAVLRGRTLVVVPKSVIFNWRAELSKFRPALRVGIYHGTERALDADWDVTLTTYAVLRLDQEALTQVEWDCIVLDEAQNIKNSDSLATQAAHALKGRFRLALTGTPIENRLEELWSEMQFVNPGLLGGLSSFKRRFIEPLARGDAEAGERLRRRVRPFVLRRLKTEVAKDLPPKTEDVLWVELSEAERTVYDAMLGDSREQLRSKSEQPKTVIQALEILLRLRQVCCHCGLLPGRAETSSAKLDRLFESLDEVLVEGQKAIVFSQWTGFLDLVEPGLRDRGVSFLRLDGSTRDREGVVRDFQDEAGSPVLLASLKAGGTGLNLTAADHVYLLDPWWNPAAEAQAADRAHRIGRESPVFVHRLIACGTVEERVLLLQEKKRALGQFVDGADPSTGLTQVEIEELLQ